jgi:hypothetical protein
MEHKKVARLKADLIVLGVQLSQEKYEILSFTGWDALDILVCEIHYYFTQPHWQTYPPLPFICSTRIKTFSLNTMDGPASIKYKY